MRAFVSVDLDELADEVARHQAAFDLPGVDPVAPDSAHVTVQFLGDVSDPGAVVNALQRAVAAADTGPFPARFEGYGVFPSLEYISVVWAGVTEGAAELTQLQEAVAGETATLGFDSADHSFTPHVTLARVRDARSKATIQQTVTERDPTLGSLEVAELRLTESTLTDEGPEYETVAAVPL